MPFAECCVIVNMYFRDSLDVFFFLSYAHTFAPVRVVFCNFCVFTRAIWHSRSRNMRLYLNLFYDQSKFCNFNFKRNCVSCVCVYLCFLESTTLGVGKMFILTGIRLQMNLTYDTQEKIRM